MTSTHRLLLLFPLSLVLLLGCSKGNPNAPAKVSGKVTYKGSPVTGGTIVFHSKDAGAHTFTLDSSGAYSGSDLPVGEMKVTVETESVNPEKKTPEYRGGKGPMGGRGAPKGGMQMSPRPDNAPAAETGTYLKIPEKYSKQDSSGLTVTLEKGSQTKDFDLTD